MLQNIELAINSNFLKNHDEFENIKIISKKGFKNVFLWWGDEDNNSKKVKLCKKLGLNVIFAHLEFKNVNCLWTTGIEGDQLVENYKKQFKLLQKCNIPIAITHAQRTPNPPQISVIGLKRFKELVFWAEKYNVILAIENSWRLDYIDYLFENISSPNFKICYDSGHDHSFTHDKFDFNKYKNKIVAIHLHDNNGEQDQHRLPFDGNINWKSVIKKIQFSGYDGPVTLELTFKEEFYKEKSIEEFIELSFERGILLAEMFKKYYKNSNRSSENEKNFDKKQTREIVDVIKNFNKNNKPKGIVVAGFGAIGKTWLGEHYPNIIDMESGFYAHINEGFEQIDVEERKGTNYRPANPDWPENYFKAIVEARKHYDVVLTSMHWDLLKFYEDNNIPYYLAFPEQGSEQVLANRCYARGNNQAFTEKMIKNVKIWNEKLKEYHPIKILTISKKEYLEEVLKKENII